MSAVTLNETSVAIEEEMEELKVTFQPQLHLERQGWVLKILRQENVTQVRSRPRNLLH